MRRDFFRYDLSEIARLSILPLQRWNVDRLTDIRLCDGSGRHHVQFQYLVRIELERGNDPHHLLDQLMSIVEVQNEALSSPLALS